VEEKIKTIERPRDWTQDDESLVYNNALSEVVSNDDSQTWADGNIRVGDYILLIDSDTRVPSDCFLDAVSEMEQSPRVAIMQYYSGVIAVTDSFFERGITFFTNLIYTQIRYAVANGDVAPFVGHNAMLRWTAVQEIAYDCPLDGREKYWSEATVSEDFDMALRLQTYGYLVRLAVYTGDGFKEGVSLTVYDELARWEKYAYGCNELIFHPIHQWLTKGPITPLFRKFLTSTMPLPSKFTILAYIGTYYALGSSWILTLMNYFVVGWYIGWFDHYYLDSFKIFFAIVIVFTALGNVALATLRYRCEERALLSSLLENLKWVPLLVIFLGGVSLHISQALLSHMCGIDMSWGATSKEAENVSFFEEIPRVLRRFKWTFAFCFALTALLVSMALVVPDFWRIEMRIAVLPLSMVTFSHFMLPIALNPNLMLFTW
jgi:membrane glycosyltransferase